jgi:tetratricopeptide (TPR) repeat protein/tRNA A-37 threonylcarbamoyl transferase component Bud32
MTIVLERLSAALADRYTIEHELGAGGMATVYLAEDLRHKRKVAMKVLRPELAAVLGADRFLREIEIAAKLQHPHILTLIDSGEADGFLYYVMPYVDGDSLRSKLDRERELPVQEAVRIIREVVDALVHAHAKGVVHRDIKPDNVLLSGRHAVVTDFGIAKAVSEATGALQITTAGVALGTPTYMSPEQAVGAPNVDHRADIYAVGVMAYEMLVGEPPFAGANPQAILSAHVTQAPKALTESRTTVSPELGAAVMKCLEKKPADRWQSAEELHAVLEALAPDSGGTTPVPGSRPLFTGKRLPALVAAASAVLLLVGWLVFRGPEAPGVAVSTNRVAVFPFAVRSANPDFQYLREGVAELMATALDGAGEMRSVDPSAVLRSVSADDEPPDVDRAESIARGLGAGRFVVGSITDVGAGRIQLRASLYETGTTDPILVDRTGTADRALELVRGATRDLLTDLLGSGIADAEALMTTDSVEALKAYVAGARAYRVRDFRSAVAAFQEAIAVDPEFAWAYHKLSMAAGWAEMHELSDRASDEALRLSDRLSERQRLILAAVRAHYQGDPAIAEQTALTIVRDYPDDSDAWYILGETRMHYNHVFGRPPTEAREPLEQAVAADPGSAEPWQHLYDLALLERDLDEIASLDRRRGATALVHPLGVALANGDSLALVSLRPPSTGVWHAGVMYHLFRVTWLWQDVSEGLQLLNALVEHDDSSVEALGHSHRAALHTAVGHRAAAVAEIDEALDAQRGQGMIQQGVLAAVGFPPWPESAVATVRSQLVNWNAAAEPECVVDQPFICVHDGLYPVLRLFLVGALDIQAGNVARGVAYADSLERYQGTEVAEMLGGDQAGTLRAMAAAASGDPSRVLEELDGFRGRFSLVQVRDSPFMGRAFENRLAARALYELGRDDEAIERSQALYGFLWAMAESHLLRGEIHERQGDVEAALEAYDRFLELWESPDPEFQPIVDDVRNRVGRLAGEQAGR